MAVMLGHPLMFMHTYCFFSIVSKLLSPPTAHFLPLFLLGGPAYGKGRCSGWCTLSEHVLSNSVFLSDKAFWRKLKSLLAYQRMQTLKNKIC